MLGERHRQRAIGCVYLEAHIPGHKYAAMPRIHNLFPLALLCLFGTLQACDSGGSGTVDVQNIRVESVTYVNNTYGSGHLTTPSGSGYTIDFEITLSGAPAAGELSRILLFGDRTSSSIGWELSGPEDWSLEGRVLSLSDLVVTNGATQDSQFELTLEWRDGSRVSYPFIHKGVFSAFLGAEGEWYDREQLNLTVGLGYGYGGTMAPDSGRVYWLADDMVLGSEHLAGEAMDGTISLRDVPSTATAFFVRLNQRTSDVPTEVYSAVTALPERVAPNVTFIGGTDLEQDDRVIQAWASGDVFVALTGQSTYSPSDPTLYVIDALDYELRSTHSFSGRVTAYGVSEGYAYVGFESGRIDEIDIATGDRRRVTTLDGRPHGFLRIGEWLLVSTEVGYSDRVLTLDASTGEIVQTGSLGYYTPRAFAYRADRQRGFADKGSISPQDILTFTFDETTGAITRTGESPYHGDHAIMSPFVLSPDGSTLYTSAGTAFSASAAPEYEGQFDFSTASLTFAPSRNRAYALRAGSYYDPVSVLDVYKTVSREHLREVVVTGVPYSLLLAGDDLAVLSMTGAQFKRLAVTTLGLSEVEPGLRRTPRGIIPTAGA